MFVQCCRALSCQRPLALPKPLYIYNQLAKLSGSLNGFPSTNPRKAKPLAPQWYPPYLALCMTFVTPIGGSWFSNPSNCLIMLAFFCSKLSLFFLVKSGLSSCQLILSNFFLKTAACRLMSIVKVTSDWQLGDN